MESSEQTVETVDEELTKPAKAKKGKKRPSDFEIIRTILQRTNERKLPWLVKNLGEDPDVLFLCSAEEDGFTYGSSKMAICIVEFDEGELNDIAQSILSKLHGYDAPGQVLINLRDQISELTKTKGESLDLEVESDAFGSVWTTKSDVRGQERTVYMSRAVDSLFNFRLIRDWCQTYRPLLRSQDNTHLTHPYTHPDGDTYTTITIPPCGDQTHPIGQNYPDGFRARVTRGIDVLITKAFEDFPYPIQSEELIAFTLDGAVCQVAHRVIAQGWRMLIIRPNCVYLPTTIAETFSLGKSEL